MRWRWSQQSDTYSTLAAGTSTYGFGICEKVDAIASIDSRVGTRVMCRHCFLVDEYLMSASFDRTIVLWNTHRRDVAPNPHICEITRS